MHYNMRGFITIVSKNPVTKGSVKEKHLFDFFTVGGFCIKDRDTGQDIIFDWEQSSGDFIELDDGRIGVEAELLHFDEEFTESSNEFDLSKITWESLFNGTIDEILYDIGYFDGKEETSIEMEIQTFGVYNPYDAKEKYEFSKEELQQYNKKEAERL